MYRHLLRYLQCFLLQAFMVNDVNREEELRILSAVFGEQRCLLPAYSGQTIPLPPYSIHSLLQYIR